MTTDTTVKFFNEGMPGAPGLSGTAGALISVLDACLVTGFGLRSATGLVVAAGVATVTLSSDAKNPALLDSVILVAGATPAELNGEQRVTGATSTTLTYTTTAATGTATGTITVKSAPAGWVKLFSGTNLAAYKSALPESFGTVLRVDDTGTLDARVRGYEALTDINTGTGPFPTVAQSAGAGGYWSKSTAANATANRWDLFADGRGLYYAPSSAAGAAPTAYGQAVYWFGDVAPAKSTDVFAACLLSGAAAPNGMAYHGTIGTGNNSAASYWVRGVVGIGSAVAAFSLPETGNTSNAVSGADNLLGAFPPPDGKLRLARYLANEAIVTGTGCIPRGTFPGLSHVPQTGLYSAFQRGDKVVPTGYLAGRKLYAVQVGQLFADTQAVVSAGRAFADITGPWLR